MDVLHISTRDFLWGAAKAAARLHEGLLSQGVSSALLVRESGSSLPNILQPETMEDKLFSQILPQMEKLAFIFYKRRAKTVFSTGVVYDTLNRRLLMLKSYPQIVNIHWIGQSFMSLKTISRIRCPIVITMHDSWYFTGGCHVPNDCLRYMKECGLCPQLGSNRQRDLSSSGWSKKHKIWDQKRPVFVSPSKWLASCAKKSSLLRNMRIEVVPNGIDEKMFDIRKRDSARQLLGLEKNKKYVLFGANSILVDKNKGFAFLKTALLILKAEGKLENTEFLIFGSEKPHLLLDGQITEKNFGVIHDDIALSLLYASADVMVVPSMLENFPNVILEAMSSGTPVVSFKIGGIPEMIDHYVNGYLAKPFIESDLAQGISWALNSDNIPENIAKLCREKVEKLYTRSIMAATYTHIYEELCSSYLTATNKT